MVFIEDALSFEDTMAARAKDAGPVPAPAGDKDRASARQQLRNGQANRNRGSGLER